MVAGFDRHQPRHFLWLLRTCSLAERTWWGMWIAVIPVVYWQAQWTGELDVQKGSILTQKQCSGFNALR